MGSLQNLQSPECNWEAHLPVFREFSECKRCAHEHPLYNDLSLSPALFLLLAGTGGRLGGVFCGTAASLPGSRLAHRAVKQTLRLTVRPTRDGSWPELSGVVTVGKANANGAAGLRLSLLLLSS